MSHACNPLYFCTLFIAVVVSLSKVLLAHDTRHCLVPNCKEKTILVQTVKVFGKVQTP